MPPSAEASKRDTLPVIRAALYAVFVLALMVLSGHTRQSFIYFAF